MTEATRYDEMTGAGLAELFLGGQVTAEECQGLSQADLREQLVELTMDEPLDADTLDQMTEKLYGYIQDDEA